MRALLATIVLFLPACDPDAVGGGKGAGFDCEEVAIPDADGNPDPCDVQACEACTDACGDGCMILESYPPQWACEDASFTVYDFCPDWTAPGSTGT